MKRRLLAWILAICVGASLLPATALAADAAETGEELKRMIEAAPDDGTRTVITLAADITDMTSAQIVEIGEGQNIVLDMDGYSIAVSAEFEGRPFVNYGTLTIRGDGTIDVTAAGANGWGPVNNYGTLTIESGTFLAVTDTNTTAIWNRAGGHAYFNGGTFVGGASTIAAEAGAYTEINGGQYENTRYPTIENRGEMLITGGAFKNTSCSSCSSGWGYTVRSGQSSSGAYLKIRGAEEDGVQVTGVQGGLAVVGGTADIYNGVYETIPCEKHPSGASAFYAGYFTGESYETSTNLYGGTFRSFSQNAIQVGNGNPAPDSGAGEESTVMIYGGTFTGGDGGKTAIVVE